MQLIYLCPAIKKPVGGVKIIYRQAELANKLLLQHGHQSLVLHPNAPHHKTNWFNHKTTVSHQFFGFQLRNRIPSFTNILGKFNPNQHRLVIPEVWARKYGWQLNQEKVPYAIFVQNGYFINKGNSQDLDEAYAGARSILTISDDSSRCVALAFPGCESRIQRIHYSVESEKFKPGNNKENIITYMPRKLADHSNKVLFFLQRNLPSNWKIIPISGLNEEGVVNLLQRSKIFMSFSHFEGCPLPPLEAALCGNYVIGYTGQGAKEYWYTTIFDEVESGDVATYAEKVLKKVKHLNNVSDFVLQQDDIGRLSREYSPSREQFDLEIFLQKIFN